MDPVTAPSSPRHAQASPRECRFCSSGTSIPDETTCGLTMNLSLSVRKRQASGDGWLSEMRAAAMEEYVFCLELPLQEMDIREAVYKKGCLALLFEPNSTATAASDPSDLPMNVTLLDSVLRYAGTHAVAALTFRESRSADVVRRNVPLFDVEIRDTLRRAARVVSWHHQVHRQYRRDGSFLLLVPQELQPVFNLESPDTAAVEVVTAKARSSAAAGTNITNPGSPSSAGNGSSGSALRRLFRKLGGSRPSDQLPIVDPSLQEPALRRRGFAAAAPGPSLQRRSSASAESTGISISEIPLGDRGTPPPTLSSASSSPSRGTPTRTPSAAAGENAAHDATGSDEQVGARRSGSPERPAPAPVATDREDAMKILAINVALNGALLVPLMVNIKDISSWETGWRELYGIVLLLSLLSTVIAIYAAWSRSNWWAIKFSSSCVRLGLLVVTALSVVNTACQLRPFGCVAGVPAAAVFVLVLAVVWWKC